MRVIEPVVHNVIDYVLILSLWLSPSLFAFSGTVTIVFYSAGFLHLFNTFCTISPLGLFKIIPFKIHGWVELGLGVLLILLPWILGFSAEVLGRNFSVIFGFCFVIFWSLSVYRYYSRGGSH